MREKEIHAAVAVFLGESGLFGSKESKCCDSNTTAGCRQRRSFQGLPARASAPKSGNSTFSQERPGRGEPPGSAPAATPFLPVAHGRASDKPKVALVNALARPIFAG